MPIGATPLRATFKGSQPLPVFAASLVACRADLSGPAVISNIEVLVAAVFHRPANTDARLVTGRFLFKSPFAETSNGCYYLGTYLEAMSGPRDSDTQH